MLPKPQERQTKRPIPPKTPTSSTNYFSAALSAARAVGTAAEAAVKYAAGLDKATRRRRRARLGTPLAPEMGEGQNKAAIEVHQRGLELSAKDTLVGTFYDFILANVQENDAEKVSVMETFGDPHLFASGRFIRKYVFSGACRTAPLNWQSQDVDLLVSQFLSFRVFYDKYLRVTEQVKWRRFTRIIVDGDVYEGWVTTMNLGRAAENEQVAPFTFTLYGVKRSHKNEAQAEQLLKAFKPEGKTKRKFDFARAQANLTDALGKITLTLQKELNGSGATSLSVPDAKVGKELVSETIGYLKAVGSAQVLTVKLPNKFEGALQLEYKGGTPVSNTLATTCQESENGQPLVVRVLNVQKLLKNLDPTKIPTDIATKEVEIKIDPDTITITAATGSPVTLFLGLTVSVGGGLKVTAVNVQYLTNNSAAKGTAPANGTEYLLDAVIGTTPGVIGADNKIPITLTVEVAPTLGPVLESWFTNPTWKPKVSKAVLSVGDRKTDAKKASDDPVTVEGDFSTPVGTIGESGSKFTINGILTPRLAGGTDLRTNSVGWKNLLATTLDLNWPFNKTTVVSQVMLKPAGMKIVSIGPVSGWAAISPISGGENSADWVGKYSLLIGMLGAPTEEQLSFLRTNTVISVQNSFPQSGGAKTTRLNFAPIQAGKPAVLSAGLTVSLMEVTREPIWLGVDGATTGITGKGGSPIFRVLGVVNGITQLGVDIYFGYHPKNRAQGKYYTGFGTFDTDNLGTYEEARSRFLKEVFTKLTLDSVSLTIYGIDKDSVTSWPQPA
jgi:hypothetical protein